MKNYFIINPVAGQGDKVKEITSDIENVMASRGEDYEIHITEYQGQALALSKNLAENLNGEEARFFAAGGDGTANEVANGVFGHDNISVGIIPIGTGNDMVRNFPDAGDFMSIKAQIEGEKRPVDLIKYSGIVDGTSQEAYCLNMINIGFDCNVVELAGRLKEKPLIAGSFAYLLSVFIKFIKRDGISLIITEFGEDKFFSRNLVREGEMLLCAVCNGSYCGGGIKSAPMSIVDDGKFELNIINKVSRMRFLRIFPKFQKGEHLSIPGIEKVVDVREYGDVLLEPYEQHEFFICVDGEIKKTTGIRVKIVPQALNLIVPKKYM